MQFALAEVIENKTKHQNNWIKSFMGLQSKYEKMIQNLQEIFHED